MINKYQLRVMHDNPNPALLRANRGDPFMMSLRAKLRNIILMSLRAKRGNLIFKITELKVKTHIRAHHPDSQIIRF